MSKERTTPEAAAAAFGVGKIARHMFVCTGPDCTTPEQGESQSFVSGCTGTG